MFAFAVCCDCFVFADCCFVAVNLVLGFIVVVINWL